MNRDFLIKINNSKELEENNIGLTNSNIYCFWCDREELEKTSLTSSNNYSHISCFLSSKEDKITNLVNGGYILIFLKTPKVLYGVIKIDSIIMKSLPEKHYLDDVDEEDEAYIKNLKNNELIKIDCENYTKLIKQYRLVEVPKMFIVKFNHLYYFGYEIGIKKLNDYVKNYPRAKLQQTEQIQIQNQQDFKYPSNVQNKELKKCWDVNFLDNFLTYFNHLNFQDKIIIETETDIETKTKTKTKTDIETNLDKTDIQILKTSKFCIPVLWNGCGIIQDMLIRSKSKPNKKIILKHYSCCKDCEINDNNGRLLNLDNKKIVIKNINSKDDIELFNLIVNNYTNVNNLNISNTINISNDLKLEKNKINIVSCPKSQDIYSNCLFIVE